MLDMLKSIHTMEFIIIKFEGDNDFENFGKRVTTKLDDGYQPYGGLKVHMREGHGYYMVQAVVKKTGPIVKYHVDAANLYQPNRIAKKDSSWIPQGEPCCFQLLICQAFIRHDVDLLGLTQQ